MQKAMARGVGLGQHPGNQKVVLSWGGGGNPTLPKKNNNLKPTPGVGFFVLGFHLQERCFCRFFLNRKKTGRESRLFFFPQLQTLTKGEKKKKKKSGKKPTADSQAGNNGGEKIGEAKDGRKTSKFNPPGGPKKKKGLKERKKKTELVFGKKKKKQLKIEGGHEKTLGVQNLVFVAKMRGGKKTGGEKKKKPGLVGGAGGFGREEQE